jgi:hypothetical protein
MGGCYYVMESDCCESHELLNARIIASILDKWVSPHHPPAEKRARWFKKGQKPPG